MPSAGIGLIDALRKQSGMSTGAIEISASLATAQYILIGRLSREKDGDVEYTLALSGLFGALDPSTVVRSQVEGKTIMCSNDSKLPLRTDWVSVGKNGNPAAVDEIQTSALKLGRSRSCS